MIRIFTIIIALTTLVATGPAQAMGLKVTLADVGDSTVEVTLTNESFVTQALLRWESPFESELTADTFLLVNEDNPAVKPEYTGKLLKRGQFKDSDFITLQSGEEISSLIKLTDYYDVDLDGTYRVTLAGHINVQQPGAQQTLVHTDLLSNTISVRLSVKPEAAFALPAQVQSCSADQQSLINSAIQQAEILSMEAKRDLDSLTTAQSRINSPRLTKWFGEYDDNRFNKISNVHTQIAAALSSEQLTIKCNCPPNFSNVFAFVFPNQPLEITVCPIFWNAPLVGTDSKAGTLIHELSHFTVIGGTDDHVYTTGPVRQLAISDPVRAADNAETYEYFAENTPHVDILGSGSTSMTTTGEVQTASGQVASGTSDQYSFSGIGQLTLISNSGDADLEVFLDGNLVCESVEPPTLNDVCVLNESGEYDVYVVGYSDASYELRVESFTTVAVQGGGGSGVVGSGAVGSSGGGGSGGGSGGGGAFGMASIFSLLAVVLVRFRRRVNMKLPVACSLGVLSLSACHAAELNADKEAASRGAELKNKNILTKVVSSEEVASEQAAAILKLDSIKKEYLPAEQVDVVFSLYNNSDKPLEYLPWGTPLEANLTRDVFAIELNGDVLPYVGPVVKRRPPVKEDHDILQPGENREVVVNVASYYDMTAAGSYIINWRDDGALAYQFRDVALAAPGSVEILRNSQ